MLFRQALSVVSLGSLALAVPYPSPDTIPATLDLLSASLESVLNHLSAGNVSSLALVDAYLARIEADNHKGLLLRAVIETAPPQTTGSVTGVRDLAKQYDEERAAGTVRGRLHGVPMLVKDNCATDIELGMNTTAGSYALLGSSVPRDSHIVALLRQAGAIILGKANLSEFANYKGNIVSCSGRPRLNVQYADLALRDRQTNGWSARGGQTQSAYVIGGFAAGGDPCGSSAGSGVGTSAGWAAAAIGTETDGSIICPSNRAALYGIKPTVGLASRAGIVPISSTQDTPGPMAKSAFDAALILSVISGFDERDNATIPTQYRDFDYTTALVGKDGFKGLRLGVPRELFFNETLSGNSPEINIAVKYFFKFMFHGSISNHQLLTFSAAITKIASLGATIQDPANLPSSNDFLTSNNETFVLDTDFKVDLAAYLAALNGSTVLSLEDVINFNDAHADLEFPPGECCQQTLMRAVQTTGKDTQAYADARFADLDIGRTRGIDAVLKKYNLDALVLPSEGFATAPAAIAGYPIVTVPLGYLNATGQPFGLAFIGTAYSERTLIQLMSAFEANFPPRRVPQQLK
ncbi:amidase, partial [Phenoliferia sp. Uapishka_3]